MKCYYEILNVPKDASEDDLKKSYRKLALKWHPDKNPDNIDEAKREFILVQQAYEVLIDDQERAWYDKHREAILKGAGSGYKDDSLDIYPYLSVSCFRGYNDSETGFYTVYREVFNNLAAEESEYLTDDDTPAPEFGDSKSSYETVKRFYGYWSSFCTKKSYFWLNTYDISEAENRRILRLMEQENRKVRDKAKKERNEEIRFLVAFVRKRDERVKAYAEYLKQKTEENSKKAEENRRKMIAKHRENIETYKESEWSKFSNLENELKEIESTMASEFNDESDNSDIDDLFCVACNKYFKTEKAFANHEKSKKHKENATLLKSNMEAEDELINGNGIDSDDSNDCEMNNELSEKEDVSEHNCDSSDEIPETKECNQKSKKKKKKTLRNPVSDDDTSTIDLGMSKKQRKKLEREKLLTENGCDSSESEVLQEDETQATKKSNQSSKSKKNKKKNNSQAPASDEEVNALDVGGSKKQKKKLEREKVLSEKTAVSEEIIVGSSKSRKNKEKKQKKNDIKTELAIEKQLKNSDIKFTIKEVQSLNINHECATCKETFESKNKLFQHLESSGHSILLPTKGKNAKMKKKK